MASAGTPEPFLMNVHSTMNSRGPFALFMMAGILLLLNNASSLKGSLNFFVVPIGYLAMLLTRVRTSWFAFFIGLLFLWTSLKPKYQMLLIITFTVMTLGVVALINIEQFSDRISSRFGTFSDLEEDGSFQARQSIYAAHLTKALFNFVGNGMGGGIGNSGILSMLFTLGWIGVILYWGGFILILLSLFKNHETRFDQFICTVRSIVISILAILPMGNPMSGVGAALLWALTGIGMAGQKYYQNERPIKSNSLSSINITKN
ncbi:MAG: hypothetical protein GVY04_00025 [Cyanobacteria bacterium]|nr:hypothetical protein [Cyanobacteria bacterium GSL.Bin1]